jgi:hypothetical protein
MLSGSLVIKVQRVLRLRMEGSCEYTKQAVADRDRMGWYGLDLSASG